MAVEILSRKQIEERLAEIDSHLDVFETQDEWLLRIERRELVSILNR